MREWRIRALQGSSSWSPMTFLICGFLSFVSFDLLVSSFDSVPISFQSRNAWHALIFGLGLSGVSNLPLFWHSCRRPLTAISIALGVAFVASVAIVYRLGAQYWVAWTAGILCLLPSFVIALGCCRVIDQLARRITAHIRQGTD